MKKSFALAGLLLVLYATLYSVAVFSGSYVSGTVRDPAVYQWAGETIVVQRKGSARGCTVTPDGGGAVAIEVASTDNKFGSATELRPWFPGGAIIKCQGGFRVWTGWAADLRLLTTHPAFFAGSVLLISVPIVYSVIRRRRKQLSRNP